MNMYIKSLCMAILSTAGLRAATEEATYHAGWDITKNLFKSDLAALQSRNMSREEAIASHLRSLNTCSSVAIDKQLTSFTDLQPAVYEDLMKRCSVIKDVLKEMPARLDKNTSQEGCIEMCLQLVQIIPKAQAGMLGGVYPNNKRIELLTAHKQHVADWVKTANTRDIRHAYHAEWKGVSKFSDFAPGLIEQHKRAMQLLIASAYLGVMDDELMVLDSPEFASLQDQETKKIYREKLKNNSDIAQKISFTLNTTEKPVDKEKELVEAFIQLNADVSQSNDVIVSAEADARFDQLSQKDSAELTEQEKDEAAQFLAAWSDSLDKRHKASEEKIVSFMNLLEDYKNQ